MQTKKKVYTPEPDTLSEKLKVAFNDFLKTQKAILDDYCAGNDGMDTELEAAAENFHAVMEDLSEMDAEAVAEIIESASFSSSDITTLLAKIDESDMKYYLEDNGHLFREEGDVVIQINNLKDRMKLEEFLTTEIYPDLTDQNSFLIHL